MVVESSEEIRFLFELFSCAGLSAEDAGQMAASLTEADLRGIDSHGIARAPIYFDRIQSGVVSTRSELTVVADTPALCVCDAHNGIGHMIGRKAMRLAMEKARKTGIGMVAVRNSNHFGVAAEYSMMASEQGMFGIAMSNTTPLMPPPGGLGKAIGNNPLSLSFPLPNAPDVTVDMAMTTAAHGKLLVRQAQGEPVPVGWGVDKDGKSTTDPAQILNGGYLLPFGGAKGYGLALSIEILTGVLAGGAVGSGVKALVDKSGPAGVSHNFIAVDYRQVCPEAHYCEKMEQLSGAIHGCDRLPGVERLFFPGEIAGSCRAIRQQAGIPIGEKLCGDLRALAERLHIAPMREKPKPAV